MGVVGKALPVKAQGVRMLGCLLAGLAAGLFLGGAIHLDPALREQLSQQDLTMNEMASRITGLVTAMDAALPSDHISASVQRSIVPDVWAALAQELKARGALTAAVTGCGAAPSAATTLEKTGIAVECISSHLVRRRSSDHPYFSSSSSSPFPSPGGAPVALLRLQSAEKEQSGLLNRLDTVLLLRSGVGGARAYAEVVVNGTSGMAKRAVLMDLRSGQRVLWSKEERIHADTFSKIYDDKIWTEAGGGSGQGSSLDHTASIRASLKDVIKRYNIHSMLDTSCGSMAWMPLVLEEVEKDKPDFRFHGTDVVCSLIEHHSANFTAVKHPNWKFDCIDYANEPLPKGYDLVWSRDSLQHVSWDAAWQFLNNVKASGAKYLLVGSYLNYEPPNIDIKAGDYYPINLLKPPFNLQPPPIQIIKEHTPDNKYMLLFDVEKLQWDDALTGLD